MVCWPSVKCRVTASVPLFLSIRDKFWVCLLYSEFIVSPTYSSLLQRSHFIPYTKFSTLQSIFPLVRYLFPSLSSNVWETIMYLHKMQIFRVHFFVPFYGLLNILLCFLCTKISFKFSYLLYDTIVLSLIIYFTSSWFLKTVSLFFKILFILGSARE